MKTYFKYTQRFVQDKNFLPWIYLNWYYDLSFFMDFPEYKNEKIISVIDWCNFEPWYWVVEHTFTDEEKEYFKTTIPSEFNFEEISTEEVLTMLRSKYNEVEEWKFLIYEEQEEMGEITPAKYIII